MNHMPPKKATVFTSRHLLVAGGVAAIAAGAAVYSTMAPVEAAKEEKKGGADVDAEKEAKRGAGKEMTQKQNTYEAKRNAAIDDFTHSLEELVVALKPEPAPQEQELVVAVKDRSREEAHRSREEAPRREVSGYTDGTVSPPVEPDEPVALVSEKRAALIRLVDLILSPDDSASSGESGICLGRKRIC